MKQRHERFRMPYPEEPDRRCLRCEHVETAHGSNGCMHKDCYRAHNRSSACPEFAPRPEESHATDLLHPEEVQR